MTEGTPQHTAKKPYLGSILMLLFVVAAFGALYYVAKFFQGEEEQVRSEKPIIFCQPENAPPEEQQCWFTTHIHVYPTVRVFGKERPLPFEKGDLSKHHTHSQENKIHWHKLVEVDPVTKGVPEEEFKLGKVFDDMGIYFTQDGVFDHRVGEINPQTGQPAELKMLVNGEPNDQFREYGWKDKDRIDIIFE